MKIVDESCLPDGMPTLRVMPMPADANIHGDVFGGWIMAQVDMLVLSRQCGARMAGSAPWQ